MIKKIILSFLFSISYILIINAQVQVTYLPTDEIFFNPERGFYNQLDTQGAGTPLTLSQLTTIKNQGKSIIHRMYYLKSFRNAALNSTILNMITSDLSFVRQAGLKCVLRFAYSQSIGEADAPLNIVLNHIDQIKPILQQNSDIILVMQAGFIGAWGEWHSSTNGLDTVTNRRTILFKILDALPSNRMVQVRTPLFKQEIFETINPLNVDSAFRETYYSRTGHHNDCFLAEWDDWGTYNDTTADKQYLADECLFVPMGGETCNPSAFTGCGNSVYQMRRLHWTYLNSGYHPTVLNGWVTNGCMNDIKRNLGYRFQLIEGNYSDLVKPGNGVTVQISLTNLGNASLFNPRNVELILTETTSGEKYFCKLPDDPRFWKTDSIINLNYVIGIKNNHNLGTYKLSLNLPEPENSLHDKKDYCIRVANQDVWDATTGYNDLGVNIVVNNNAAGQQYNGELWFEPLVPTSIEDEINNLESGKSQLKIQSYPNPFNSTTQIKFEVAEASNISLKLFNSLGEQVDTIINDYRLKGEYNVDYNADNLCSGVYFCVLSDELQSVSSKLLLIK
jgi:hypothetical protein